MFDARNLVGTLLGSGMGGMNRRPGFGGRGVSGGGGLGGLLGAIGGMSGGGRGSGLATLGGLAGLMGVGGKFGKAAGLATLGGLALHALQNYQQQKGMDPRASGLPEAPRDTVSEDDAVLIVRAMVAAANADGRIDADEEQRILGQVQESGASAEERAFLERELRNPAGIEEIARRVQGGPLAQQVYGASLLAMTADTPAEQSYLRYLADRIGLDRAEVEDIHRQLGVALP